MNANEERARRAAALEDKRKIVVVVLAALFHAADRCSARRETIHPGNITIGGARPPAEAFAAADAFMAEAAARGISIVELLGD